MSHTEITFSDFTRAMLIAKGFKPKALAEKMGITENAARHVLRDRGELYFGRFTQICVIIGVNPDTLLKQWELGHTVLNRDSAAVVEETTTSEESFKEACDLFEQLTIDERYYLLAFLICLKRMRAPAPARVAELKVY